ncbi:hypothetical protein HYT55_01345 [Candidatus Woesearchaeota archaeon]|nr:hypothetical protein [Candidatus Woesearchaeota archaeon]
MNIYFLIHAKKEEDIPEIRSYLEVYAPEIITEEPRGKTFRARSFPITYEHLFRATLFRTEQGWQQHGESRIPDSLEDVVERVELYQNS